jgi:hypothetical protein
MNEDDLNVETEDDLKDDVKDDARQSMAGTMVN